MYILPISYTLKWVDMGLKSKLWDTNDKMCPRKQRAETF